MADTETLTDKVYSPLSSVFSNLGANDKLDVRTTLGKGLLKRQFSAAVYDVYSEELCFKIAKKVGIPCVLTRQVWMSLLSTSGIRNQRTRNL